MKQSRFTDEQMIGFHKQAYAGMSVKEHCRSGCISQPSISVAPAWRYIAFRNGKASRAENREEQAKETHGCRPFRYTNSQESVLYKALPLQDKRKAIKR
jgi:hypothetical protein